MTVWIWLTMGCEPDISLTQVKELRVMAAVFEPTAIDLTEEEPTISQKLGNRDVPKRPTVGIRIWDPENKNVESLTWQCTNFGNGCLEDSLYPLEKWIQYHTEKWIVHETHLPNSVRMQLLDSPDISFPFRGSEVWTLSCYTDTCNIIEQYKNGEDISELLNDPLLLSANTPLIGSSLSRKKLILTDGSEKLDYLNPLLTPSFDLDKLTKKANETIKLRFNFQRNGTLPRPGRAYVYTTIGYIEDFQQGEKFTERQGYFEFKWTTPEASPDDIGKMMVVFDNRRGGTTFWESPIKISND